MPHTTKPVVWAPATDLRTYRAPADEQRKGNPMKSLTQALVHHMLAAQINIDEAVINDSHTFDELGLDPVDLALVAIRLEDLHQEHGEFSLAQLDFAATVGDFVMLYELWLQRGVMSNSIRATGS